ncbi:sphingomyelin phosphodiesterase isoform X2 [Lasioglossum baleicum]
MISHLRIPTELQNSNWRTFSRGSDIAMCSICRATVKLYMNLRREGMSAEKIQNQITKLCVLLNIQTEPVCKGVIELNMPTILHIVDTKPNLEANTICGVIFESKSCPLTNAEYEWTIVIDNSSAIEVAEKEAQEPLKILQLTDFHYDPAYEPRGNAQCKEPICCRKGQNNTNVESLAGYWGDYNACDTPWHSIVDALTHINDTHRDLNYVYFTGDIIDHGVWETSKEGNTKSLVKTYNKIHETFGEIPVYPILGNHEPNPMNQFAPKSITSDDITTNWLYKLVADLWIGYGWLPESTRSTIHDGGYYTVSPTKGFRVIALNSNICYSYNWWLWYTPRDPDNQLQWLSDTLRNAEKNQEFVHILSHIPVNAIDCLKTWRREYIKLVNRYSHIIKAQFNGHTHNDEVAIFYDSNSVAQNIAWNGGSITSYTKLNTNYKVYDVNGNNYAINDYQNWMYDIGTANKNPNKRPTWFKSYSFKTEYDVPELSARSLNTWLSAALNNETLINKYYNNFFKHAEPSLNGNCNLDCKKQYLNRIIINPISDD